MLYLGVELQIFNLLEMFMSRSHLMFCEIRTVILIDRIMRGVG
jgi:hypothetical protein